MRSSNSYKSPNIIRVIKSGRIRWAGHIARMGEMRHVYNILDGKPEGKRALGRPSCRWEDNTRLDLRVIEWEVVHLMHLAQGRDQWQAVVNTVMNFGFHKRQEIS
jgi:hypothetical protein